jgi:hypothetical protein
MKKIALLVTACATGMIQFGCGWQVAHDVAAHVLAAGWTLDLLNVVP